MYGCTVLFPFLTHDVHTYVRVVVGQKTSESLNVSQSVTPPAYILPIVIINGHKTDDDMMMSRATYHVSTL